MTREEINNMVLARKNSRMARIWGRIRDLFSSTSLPEQLGRIYVEDVGSLVKEVTEANNNFYDAKRRNDLLNQRIIVLERQVSEFVNGTSFKEEQVKKLAVKPGDFLVIHHDASNHSYGHNAFGYGLAALQYLQEELSRMAGGKVFVVAHKGKFDIQQFSHEDKIHLIKDLEKSIGIHP